MQQIKHGADIKEIQRKYGISEILDFSSNVNIFSSKIINETLSGIRAEDLNYYMDIDYIDLRNRVGEKYGFSYENIIVGNGSTEIMFLLMKLEKFKNIAIFNPTFGEYERAARLCNKSIFNLHLDMDFNLNISEFKKLNEKVSVDLLVICNPNNPTGNLNRIDEFVEYCSLNNITMMVDETFIDFSQNAKSFSALKYVNRSKNVVVIRAATKFYSLTNVRLGYAFGPKDIINQMWNIKEPWTVNIFAQRLSEVLFDNEFEQISKDFYSKEADRFKDILSKIPNLTVYTTETNYFLIKITNGIKSHKLKERLINEFGILIRDCSNFKGLDDSFIRINIKDEEKNNFLAQSLNTTINGGKYE